MPAGRIDAVEMPAKQFLTPGKGLAYAEVSDLVTAILFCNALLAGSASLDA